MEVLFPAIQSQVLIVVKTDIFLDVHNAMTAAACRRWPAFRRLVLNVDFSNEVYILGSAKPVCQPNIYTVVPSSLRGYIFSPNQIAL